MFIFYYSNKMLIKNINVLNIFITIFRKIIYFFLYNKHICIEYYIYIF
uniref:Uncharacterized protein n=1 Tax=viral metagenome TaxID=1070528 RepID=A0A6C0H7I2_9ZZZZ